VSFAIKINVGRDMWRVVVVVCLVVGGSSTKHASASSARQTPESSDQHANTMTVDDTPNANNAAYDLSNATIHVPEPTATYRDWQQRTRRHDLIYTDVYKRSRRADEAAILRGDTRRWLIEDYVLQLRVLGDEARYIDLLCRLSPTDPDVQEARLRLFKIVKEDLLEARQYQIVLRMAGNVQDGYDKLIAKYNRPEIGERAINWCELNFKGDCASEFHDSFAFFEALVATNQREEAVVLAEKIIRTRIDVHDLLPMSRYTVWDLPDDLSTNGVLAELKRSANRAGDPTFADALEALSDSGQTESDLDAFREALLGDGAEKAKRRVEAAIFRG